MKILSIFVAYLENMNFNGPYLQNVNNYFELFATHFFHKLYFSGRRSGSEVFSVEINHFWPHFSAPWAIPACKNGHCCGKFLFKALRKLLFKGSFRLNFINFTITHMYTGILFRKLFWLTVRKNCSSDQEKLLKMRWWRPIFFWNILGINRTIYSNSDRSEQILKQNTFFNLLLDISQIFVFNWGGIKPWRTPN